MYGRTILLLLCGNHQLKLFLVNNDEHSLNLTLHISLLQG